MSDEADITVTVSGKVASGKTTVALAFAQFLKDKGFTNVRLQDDFRDDVNEPYYTELQDNRMGAIANRTVRVHIQTHQTSRVAILSETLGRDPKSALGEDDCG